MTSDKEALPASADPSFGIAPRPEAFAPKEGLTQAQRRAVQGVTDLVAHWARLAEAAERFQTLPHSPLEQLAKNALRLPWLAEVEERRYAQVALIDGERGTGKTSALLSLRLEWARALQRSMVPDVSAGPSEPAHVVVPLPILDLQPHPPRQSLLGVLLGVFDPLHRSLLPDEEEAQRSVPAYLVASPQARDRALHRAWDTIFRAIAAWEGHAQRRSDRLAEDVYWRDLRDETARVSRLSEHFKAYIDALVKAWRDDPRTSRQRPLFAVMVDDADMNPTRSVELLELLRTLSHPRVFFVLTGDSTLFELMLRKHLRSAAAMPQPNGDFGLDHRDAEIVQRLAWDVLDRIIPPPQRMKMAGRAPWPEPRADGHPQAQLRYALERLLPHPSAKVPLSDFFHALDDQADELRFADALPWRLRHTLDLTMLVRARLRDTPAHSAGDDPGTAQSFPQNEVLKAWWDDVVHSTADHLLVEVRGLVTHFASEGRERLVLHRPTRPIWKAEKLEMGSVDFGGRSLRVFEFGRYAFDGHSGEPLPYAVEDMLQLLNDTLWGDTGGRLAPENFEPLVVTRWSNGRERPWWLPKWRQFTSYYRFAARLSRVLKDLMPRGNVSAEPMNFLLRYYHAISCAPLGAAEGDLNTAFGWADVRARMKAGDEPAGSEQSITSEWFRKEALLLLGPAYGLPERGVSDLLKQEGAKFSLDWDDLTEKSKTLLFGLGLEMKEDAPRRINPDAWMDFLREEPNRRAPSP
jgi:hypothetical protein